MKFLRSRSLGAILLIAAPIIAFSPLVLTLIMLPFCPGGSSGANEGNCGAAALPWFLIVSVPFGILMALVGLIALVVRAVRKSGNEPTSQEPTEYPLI